MTNRSLNFIFGVSVLLILLHCKGQTKQRVPDHIVRTSAGIVGGPFENSEFTYIGMPETIKSVDTSVGWGQAGQKLHITGTIYKLDSTTPASNVVLYYYHTDTNGLYSNDGHLDSRVIRHGSIRGWVKSDDKGHYSIYTVRPASYPNSHEPAHIHPAILEPGMDNPYYIDEFVFDDDPFLTEKKRNSMSNRGGNGILKPRTVGNLQVVKHNIILGLNIPNYPK